MEISGMLIWALVLISLIVFIVLLVKSFKSWGVVHTILLSILFIECWTFLFFAAGVAHRRLELTKKHDALMKKYESLVKTVDEELNGKRDEPKLNLEKYVPLTNELNRMALESGRVWRGATIQRLTPAAGATPATALLQLPPPTVIGAISPPALSGDPAAAATAAAGPAVETGLTVGNIVYLFGERDEPVGKIPEVYLGEFLVTDSKDLAITIRPTNPLTKDQEVAMTASPSWSIHEIMPVDSHTAFAAAGSSAEETAIFGQMKPEEIAKDFEAAFRNAPNLSEARKARILQNYVSDGARADGETAPEALAYKVKFLKDFSEPVDAKAGRSALEGSYHDLGGFMIDERLKRDEPAEIVFKTGDEYTLEALVANRLQGQGIVQIENPVFIRPLNDYAFAFRETGRMLLRAKNDKVLFSNQIKESLRTTDVTMKQEIELQDEGSKLSLDKAQYDKELEVINSVATDLETQITDKKAELSQLYKSMLTLHDTWVKKQRELTSANSAVPTIAP